MLTDISMKTSTVLAVMVTILLRPFEITAAGTVEFLNMRQSIVVINPSVVRSIPEGRH